MTIPLEGASGPDLLVWWLTFAAAALLIPFLVIAYLLHPARLRILNVREVVRRTEAALEKDRGHRERQDSGYRSKNRGKHQDPKAILEPYRERVKLQMKERFWVRNYIVPLAFLVLVLAAGFFAAASRIHPLMGNLILVNVIARADLRVFYGFLGGFLYALYSVVTRYRSQDIPPALLMQLGYQVILATAIGFFAPLPWLAFAAGFVPYAELTDWLRHTAQTWLGGSAQMGQGGTSPGRPLWSQGLETLQGVAPAHRERLGEEGILTIENLALANPLSLALVTSYSMAQIIDWIDQAYLRLYVSDEAAVKLAARGILGGIELTEVAEDLRKLERAKVAEDLGNLEQAEVAKDLNVLKRAAADQILDSLANALGSDRTGARLLLDRIEDDSQVELLSVMWSEFGAT